MHWHTYHWHGYGADLGSESERRPTSPDFPISPLPPMHTGDWLLKPESRISTTLYEISDVTLWLTDQYRSMRESLIVADRIGLQHRLDKAREVLPGGADVQWGEWLVGGRFITIGVVCCPNRHVTHRCPLLSSRAAVSEDRQQPTS